MNRIVVDLLLLIIESLSADPGVDLDLLTGRPGQAGSLMLFGEHISPYIEFFAQPK